MKIIIFAVGTVVFVADIIASGADIISRYKLKKDLEKFDWSVGKYERGNNKTE